MGDSGRAKGTLALVCELPTISEATMCSVSLHNGFSSFADMPANGMPLANQITVAVLVIVAATYDLRFRRIPNWLVLVGIVSGFALNTLGGGLSGLRMAGSGFLLAFGIYVTLFALRAMGAGDVKLMAAVGSLV